MEAAMARGTQGLSTSGRRRAVVASAGVAGLLAGAVLAEFFQQVIIVERDALSGGVEPRRGVPQGRHAHALLPRGLAALEQLFPGFAADAAQEVSWGLGGSRLCAAPNTLPVIVSTRPFLEHEIRRRRREHRVPDRRARVGLRARGRTRGRRDG
jgi:hypothetical protein